MASQYMYCICENFCSQTKKELIFIAYPHQTRYNVIAFGGLMWETDYS